MTTLTTSERRRPHNSIRDSVHRLFTYASRLNHASSGSPQAGMFARAQNTSIQNATFTINQYGGIVQDQPVLSSTVTTTAEGQSTEGLQENDLPSQPAHRESPDVYVDCLLTKNRGYPLWIPSSNRSLPTLNRTVGICIGDVGVLTPEGGFDFLFNIFYHATHPINTAAGVPEGFVPLPSPRPTDLQKFVEWTAGSYIADPSVIRVDDGSDLFATTLEATGAEGAVLMIPEDIHTTKLKVNNRLRKYVADNILDWYRFVKYTLGHDIDNGDLRVVYGCRKASGYGIATAFNTAARREKTRLTFAVDPTWAAHSGCPYRWSHTGSAEVKAGPSQQDNAELFLTLPEPARNQCLFINTIDPKVGRESWKRLEILCNAEVLSASDVENATLGPHSRDASLSTTTASVSGPVIADVHTTTTQRYQERTFHPAVLLQDMLETLIPGLDAYIVCNDDWAPCIAEKDMPASDFASRVLEGNIVNRVDMFAYFSRNIQNSSESRPAADVDLIDADSSLSYDNLLFKPSMTIAFEPFAHPRASYPHWKAQRTLSFSESAEEALTKWVNSWAAISCEVVLRQKPTPWLATCFGTFRNFYSVIQDDTRIQAQMSDLATSAASLLLQLDIKLYYINRLDHSVEVGLHDLNRLLFDMHVAASQFRPFKISSSHKPLQDTLRGYEQRISSVPALFPGLHLKCVTHEHHDSPTRDHLALLKALNELESLPVGITAGQFMSRSSSRKSNRTSQDKAKYGSRRVTLEEFLSEYSQVERERHFINTGTTRLSFDSFLEYPNSLLSPQSSRPPPYSP